MKMDNMTDKELEVKYDKMELEDLKSLLAQEKSISRRRLIRAAVKSKLSPTKTTNNCENLIIPVKSKVEATTPATAAGTTSVANGTKESDINNKIDNLKAQLRSSTDYKRRQEIRKELHQMEDLKKNLNANITPSITATTTNTTAKIYNNNTKNLENSDNPPRIFKPTTVTPALTSASKLNDRNIDKSTSSPVQFNIRKGVAASNGKDNNSPTSSINSGSVLQAGASKQKINFQKSETITAKENNTVLIKCQCDKVESKFPTAQWYFKDRKITEQPSYLFRDLKLEKQSNRNFSLQFGNCKRINNEGKYRLEIEDTKSIWIAEFELLVKNQNRVNQTSKSPTTTTIKSSSSPSPSPSSSLSSPSLPKTNNNQIKELVKNSTQPSVSHNDKHKTSKEDKEETISLFKRKDISNTSTDEKVQEKAINNNQSEPKLRSSHTFNVGSKPQSGTGKQKINFQKSETITAEENNTVLIKCQCDKVESKFPTAQWYFKDRKITEQPSYLFRDLKSEKQSNRNFSLQFGNCKRINNEGKYRLEIEDTKSIWIAEFELLVKVKSVTNRDSEITNSKPVNEVKNTNVKSIVKEPIAVKTPVQSRPMSAIVSDSKSSSNQKTLSKGRETTVKQVEPTAKRPVSQVLSMSKFFNQQEESNKGKADVMLKKPSVNQPAKSPTSQVCCGTGGNIGSENKIRKQQRCATTAKDYLFLWITENIKEYKNVSVTNFTSSWADGLAFCALIHHFYPNSFDYSKLTPTDKKGNFELAFNKAKTEANIEPLLDADDMLILDTPDYKCVFTYLTSVFRSLRNHPRNVLLKPDSNS